MKERKLYDFLKGETTQIKYRVEPQKCNCTHPRCSGIFVPTREGQTMCLFNIPEEKATRKEKIIKKCKTCGITEVGKGFFTCSYCKEKNYKRLSKLHNERNKLKLKEKNSKIINKCKCGVILDSLKQKNCFDCKKEIRKKYYKSY